MNTYKDKTTQQYQIIGLKRLVSKSVYAFGLTALTCLVLTLLDIFVVEIFFRPEQIWGEIWKCHYVYWSLIITTPVLLAWVMKSLVPFAVWLFFGFGIEDTLFYALQGYLPDIYWGVSIMGSWEPAVSEVLILNVIGVALIFIWFNVSLKLQRVIDSS